MDKIVSIDELVGKKNKSHVSLTRRDRIPILETTKRQTLRIAKVYCDHSYAQAPDHYPADAYSHPIYRQHALDEVESLARLGAIAASMTKDGGTMYDLGCGTGVASMVYNMLTGQVPIAIDEDSNILAWAKNIAGDIGANVDFRNSTIEDIMGCASLRQQDVLIASGLKNRLNDYALDLARNNNTAIIYFGIVENEDLANVAVRLPDSSHSLQIARVNTLSSLEKLAPGNPIMLRQYVILATPNT